MYKHSYWFIFRSAVCTFPTAERIFPTAERTFPIAEYKPNTLMIQIQSSYHINFIPIILILSFLPSLYFHSYHPFLIIM